MTKRMVKFGVKKRETYLEELRSGSRRGAAARSVGVSRETVRLHMHKDEAFAREVDDAEMEAHESVEDALFTTAKTGNVTAMIFYLCNRSQDRWRHVQHVHQQIDLKASVAYADMSIEEINQRLKPYEDDRVKAHVNGGPSKNGDGE